MKTAKELVAEINAAKAPSVHHVEDMVDLCGAKEVDRIDEEDHCWYTIGTLVLKLGDEFIGVRGPASLKSESSSYSDLGLECEAFEMEQVPSVTYKVKK